MDEVGVTIIGAGIIGLSVASRLSRICNNVLIVERNPKFGMETSSRNSEVIHSGIYYPQNTYKARFCVEGNRMLYKYCKTNNVKFARTGKIVVAVTNDEILHLNELKTNGTRNLVKGLKMLNNGQLKRLEPEINGMAGLFVPSAGIVDTHGLMYSLLTKSCNNGATISYNSEVSGINKEKNRFVISVNKDYKFKSRIVVNCAGLNSDKIAAMANIDIDKAGYRLHYCKGQYFKVSRQFNVKRLIYPVPAKNIQSLGIHLVLDLAGGIRFGPDSVYTNRVDYIVDDGRRNTFYSAVQKYLPSIKTEDLCPDTAGVRPKLQVEGGPFRDFVICNEEEQGQNGLINLIGIDSPGLTSCLAIAKCVEGIVGNTKIATFKRLN